MDLSAVAGTLANRKLKEVLFRRKTSKMQTKRCRFRVTGLWRLVIAVGVSGEKKRDHANNKQRRYKHVEHKRGKGDGKQK